MKSMLWATVAILAVVSSPSVTAQAPEIQPYNFVDPVIERIEVEGVSRRVRQQVLERIGVRVGDLLTVERKHRIGREIGKAQKGLGFSYRQSSRPGRVTLRIERC